MHEANSQGTPANLLQSTKFQTCGTCRGFATVDQVAWLECAGLKRRRSDYTTYKVVAKRALVDSAGRDLDLYQTFLSTLAAPVSSSVQDAANPRRVRQRGGSGGSDSDALCDLAIDTRRISEQCGALCDLYQRIYEAISAICNV
jgi:hypothetical protein